MPLFPGERTQPVAKGRSRTAVAGSGHAPESNILTGTASLVKSQAQRSLDRKKRRREFFWAAMGLLLVLVLLFVQIQYFSSSSIFFALFFFNSVLLLGILFVVLRNAMKLLLERRRRIIGSRLRTRLVLAISAMTLIPCLVMFLVTAQFVKISIDFWFQNQVESTVETSLEMTRRTYESTAARLRSQAGFCLAEIEARDYGWGGVSMDAFLERKRQEYDLALVGTLDSGQVERNWQPEAGIGNAWQEAKNNLDWERLRRDGFLFAPGYGAQSDFMFGVLSVGSGRIGYLMLVEDMGEGFWSKLEEISAGTQEYKLLRTLRRELKATLYLTLTVLTALIALATIWFAFRVGKELTAPITTLVNATERMAEGDTSVRIEDTSSDEFAVLVKAFNRMAAEIGQSRQELTDTNALLGQQNLVLDQQRRYVETVLDNIAAGVLSFDAEWHITTANKAACEFIGLKLETAIGRNINTFLTKAQSRQTRKVGLKLLRRPGSHLQHQLVFTHDGEDRHLLATSVGLPSPEGKFQGGVVVFEDVTEMEKMQRMAAWREVARRIAHEIKNPLTPIKLSAQRLEKKFSAEVSDPVFQQSTQLIVRQVELLQSMVQEFSTFAKLPEVRLRRGKIAPVLQESVDMFRNSHANIIWSLDLDPNLPDLEMDGIALQRAFLNILTNAAEAFNFMESKTDMKAEAGMEAGGTLRPQARMEIKTDAEPAQESKPGRQNPAVRVRAVYDPETRMLRIDFIDNGPGLNDDERKRMFEPYFSRKKGGTGLGLTIVRSIITEHRGYVRALPNEADDSGTVISVELPTI
ncbi:MAG: PAS domain S-box protein [Deltaproteobacteria bacterium]|jgi:two-component system nitrogen regulation sensor histidine kinase NtrY|nr:PAS domain S-box protein [Deltaproteobacteria bacterium]